VQEAASEGNPRARVCYYISRHLHSCQRPIYLERPAAQCLLACTCLLPCTCQLRPDVASPNSERVWPDHPPQSRHRPRCSCEYPPLPPQPLRTAVFSSGLLMLDVFQATASSLLEAALQDEFISSVAKRARFEFALEPQLMVLASEAVLSADPRCALLEHAKERLFQPLQVRRMSQDNTKSRNIVYLGRGSGRHVLRMLCWLRTPSSCHSAQESHGSLRPSSSILTSVLSARLYSLGLVAATRC
jgi:hypothetical protein